MQTDAIVYRPPWRILAATLGVVARGSPLGLAAALLVLDAWLGIGLRLDNPLRLLRAFAGLCLVPAFAGWLLARACAGSASIGDGMLAIERPGRRVEIPLGAIDRVASPAIPLPPGTLRLRLASGRWFTDALQVADPVAFVEALVRAGAPERVRSAARSPAIVHAGSRRTQARRWYHPLLKFVAFGLVLALPLFRLHQWIAYGGTFGEYYVYGLRPYLLGFALYWATSCVHLVLYAAVLRAVAEPIVLLTAWGAPSRVDGVRRVVETAGGVLYFAGPPLLLARLFLLSS